MPTKPTVPTDPPPTHLLRARIEAERAVGVQQAIFRRGIFKTLSRATGYSEQRREVYKRLRDRGMSYPEIAWACGLPNHSTVYTSLNGQRKGDRP